MYTGIKHLHSFLPYVFLSLSIFLVLYSLISWRKRKSYSKSDTILRSVVVSLAHIQLLIGLILYFISPITKSAFADFGAAMKDSVLRLYALEHIFINIVAVILITIGSIKAKREIIEFKKHKLVGIYLGIGTVLILSRIPWHAWPGI
ncbi:hypothetical protein AT05_09565 [Schleiferia thermophila str. Yellowstone]|jgi:hypothetical protein|uniref:hypothetical protein n=1 Tax=Schleiferia thermophila TaxID=884107 RepID=UPI0004E70580|nr:hypothetical protein [Schleiferia thermophila]KFD38483.1 hypothetical protein AT05_09565 [Schleiferia thermophila str. Yellowstone]